MTNYFTTQKRYKNGNVVVFDKAAQRSPVIQIGEQKIRVEDLNPSLQRFNEFWELMEAIKGHGYLRAAISVVGRSAVGSWWTLVKNPEAKSDPPDLQRRRLLDFYNFKNRDWTNIKDFQNFASKLMIGVMYLRYFGQAAYEVLKDENGKPVGLDHLPGLVIPNVDSSGNFKKGKNGEDLPAFVQFPTKDPRTQVHFMNPMSVVYMTNPDFEGSPLGSSDIRSIADLTLPLDFYLMTAAREYMKNRDKPEVVYMLSPDLSEEGFNQFVDEVKAKQQGSSNVGKSAIAVQGEFDIKELRPLPDQLPYQESRDQAREEELAVTGVSGTKLGLSSDLSSANMKESRREFHETSMEPLFRMVEGYFYEQIHVREFDYPDWLFSFNNPDFLTLVEKATVHMRYHGMGALSPNEIRVDMGKEERTDELGDKFADELEFEAKNPPGSEPGGREDDPDAPANTGEPTLDDQDPPRGDQHDDDTRQDALMLEPILNELKTYREFAIKRKRKGKTIRQFNTETLPMDVAELLHYEVVRAETVEDLGLVFDSAVNTVIELWEK